MKRLRRFFGGFAVALLCAVSGAFGAEGVPTLVQVGTTNGHAQVDLSWASDTGSFFEIYSTTNLAGPWTLAVAEPLASTNLIGTLRVLSADTSRFFQVRKLDTQGPAIANRYPGIGAVGVGRFATLAVALTDVSGINTNSCRLVVNGGAVLTYGCVGVTVSPDRFTYAPLAEWGAFGATVTVSFACLDLKGNATYTEWRFVLEVEPVVAGNLLHLSTVQPAQRTDARSLMSIPPRPGVLFLSGLTLIEQTTNTLTFGYSGTHGLYVGAVLVSHDASNHFYRKITSLTDDPANGRVTAYTQDVPLTDIVKEGSFSPEFLIPVGGLMQPLWGDGDLGVDIPFSYNHEFASGTIDLPPHIRLRPANLKVMLDGTLDLSCQIRNWQLIALGAEFDSSLDMEIRSGVDIYQSISLVSATKTLGSGTLAVVGGSIGPVPIWVEIQVGVDLTFEAKAAGTISFNHGYDVSATANADLHWTRDVGVTHSYDGHVGVVAVPLEVPIKLSAEANLYLKPSLSALVYSLAGASLDYRRGPGLEIAYTLGDAQAEITLSDKWSVNGALAIVGVGDDDLPKVTFLEDENIIKTWYWPEIAEAAPAFTLQPSGGVYVRSSSVTLAASASGNPAPSYQWYQNGSALPGRTAATLTFTMGASAVGSYHCTARNRLGTAASQSAIVSLPVTTPAGTAYIAAGSFRMGNTFTEGGSDERPVHTVYVSAFYMDKTEVTWAKWKEVRDWAATNGYDIGSFGEGKADGHPVQQVSWYDCEKWCNARSQKEGKTFAYYTDSGFTTVYKTGYVTPYVKWSAAGYRLPTEAEWEKAARGGLSEKRFPWGDTIQHSRANYYSLWSGGVPIYSFDVNAISGYPPSFALGDEPYTSPAGSAEPNGYGLYDMSGNVWEWCWDWYGSAYYGTSPSSNPTGPASGSCRVFRGGGWGGDAWDCRAAARQYDYRNYSDYRVGFRAVLPLGQ